MQTAIPLHILIRQGITWSAVEGILFQTVLVAHNLLLFKTIPLELYGAVGVAFSLAYGIAYGMSAGFELFYSDTQVASNSKISLAWIQAAWIGICLSALIIIRHFIDINPLIIALALSEGIKRTLKVLTFGSYQFIRVTIYELTHLLIYCCTLWMLYHTGYALSYNAIILPLIITTLFCALGYAYHLTIPRQLPDQFWWLLKRRILLCFGTLYHILFSGNLLTPLAYIMLGPVHAGGIKLASTCTHGILSIAEKVLTMNATMLGRADESATLYTMFGHYVWRTIYYGTGITLALISYTFWSRDTLFLMPYALLYLILHGAGLISLLCERTLCAESPKESLYLLFFSIFGCGTVYIVGAYLGYPMVALALFVFTRIALSTSLEWRVSRHKAPPFFNKAMQNLVLLFCSLILCVFFMRQ